MKGVADLVRLEFAVAVGVKAGKLRLDVLGGEALAQREGLHLRPLDLSRMVGVESRYCLHGSIGREVAANGSGHRDLGVWKPDARRGEKHHQ